MGIFSLAGKNIAVTGASSGFGHHFAGVLADAGANVVLGARRMERIKERVDEISANGGNAVGAELDVLNAASLSDFLDSAESAYGSIDVLINNAGIEPGAKTYAMIDEDDWDSVLDTNLKSVWQTIEDVYRAGSTEQTGGWEYYQHYLDYCV